MGLFNCGTRFVFFGTNNIVWGLREIRVGGSEKKIDKLLEEFTDRLKMEDCKYVLICLKEEDDGINVFSGVSSDRSTFVDCLILEAMTLVAKKIMGSEAIEENGEEFGEEFGEAFKNAVKL